LIWRNATYKRDAVAIIIDFNDFTRGGRNSWPTQAKNTKNISTTTIARKWFCGEEILFKARLISREKNSELKGCGCAINLG